MMFLMATDKYNCSEKSLIENFALCSDHIILSRAFRNGYILNICNLIYTTRRSSLFLLLQFPKMMTVSTLFVIQFFFLFVLSNKVFLLYLLYISIEIFDFIYYKPAGQRMEPPVSEPRESGTSHAATLAALPPDEPPGTRVVSQGFFVGLK